MNDYYVYYLIDPRTCQPFYIGKGRANRYLHHYTDAKRIPEHQNNPNKCATINSILASNNSVEVAFIIKGVGEEQALLVESKMINIFGRAVNNTGILTNIQSGETLNNCKNVHKGHPVCQYTLNGELINTYPSFSQAAYDNNIPLSRIRVCSMHPTENYVAGNFQWRLFGDDAPGRFEKHCHPNNQTPILQYSKNGEFVDQYNSVREASTQTNIQESGISKVIHNKAKCAGGFQWKKYSEGFPDNIKPYVRKSAQKKVVVQLLDGVIINTYDGITEAANKCKIHPSSIRQVCIEGRFKTVKGFTFRFI